MPRYHFNVYDADETLDEDGLQLPGKDQAKAEALRIAGELLKSEARKSTARDDWRIEVTDDRGLILFRIEILVSASSAER